MTIPLLIVTPEIGFGTFVNKGLDSQRFNVFVTSDFSQSIHFVRRVSCPVAMLDAELEEVDISILDVGYALRQINPGIQFIVVTTAGKEPKLGKLAPAATLTKPLNIPDLEQLLQKINVAPAAAPAPETKSVSNAVPAGPRLESKSLERELAETSNLMWLKDVSKAAQHLTQLTLESSAQAALITRENELWAYAGQLSREAAQELAQSIQRYWDRESESDLLRFVRLASTEAQHMLYARKLSASMILALVFDAETPFSTIRTQAGKLIRTLSDNPLDENHARPAPASAAPASDQPDSPELAMSFDAHFDADEDDDIQDLPPIADLLGDVPPPIPARQPSPTTRIALPWDQPAPARSGTDQADGGAPKYRPLDGPNMPTPATFSRETSPAMPVNSNRKEPAPGMDETRVSRISHMETDLQIHPEDLPEELRETRRHEPDPDDIQTVIETRAQGIESVTEVAHRILLEPASPALVNLTYACLLIPRFDTHHLVGDTAERLTEWVPQVCVAFGWRLEHLAVRPEYLQWVARVPPSTAPGYIMRIIRQQCSDRLFNEFPRYKADNPSGDFWAPGYLIMGSSQPHPQKLVREFIRQTRQRQGLSH
jgi:REP element-mobilizing transposase RayT/ActR/RegA family two-component response regulator